MADISVQFSNKINGYDKNEVDEFVKAAEAKLQERAVELSVLQARVTELEERLTRITGADMSVEEKVEVYDKLMKKMDGDYKNLLAPAIAKAKAIEEKAEKEYQIRIDQARYTAEGIYKEAAERIAAAVDENMDRVYVLIGSFLKTQTLPGRIKTAAKGCKVATVKVVKVSKDAYGKAKDGVKNKYATLKANKGKGSVSIAIIGKKKKA